MNYEARGLEELIETKRPRAAASLLLWGVAAFIAVFFIWAALTELDRSVRAAGRVVASSQLQVVSNLEGGVVEEIAVRTGQQVRAGQPLLRLDPTLTGAELGSSQATLGALAAKIARLRAEVTGTSPAYPAGAGEQARIEGALHAARMAEYSGLSAAAQARVAGAQRAVAEAQAAYQARQSAAAARRQEVAAIRPLVEKGIEPRLALSQAESAAAVAGSEAAQAAAGIARAQSMVAEAQASLAQQRSDWRARAAEELAATQAQMAAQRSAVPALAERVQRTLVRAPLPGRINRVLVTTVGAAVSPGQPLVEIVPSEDSLLVEARIRPQDIASVRMGQPARVNITAYDASVYGGLDGTVISISPDAVVDPATQQSFYIVQVRTAENRIRDPAGRAHPIGTGMIAEVSLLGDKRTVLSYIFSPLTKLGQSAFRE